MIAAGLGLYLYPDMKTGLLNMQTERFICEFEEAFIRDEKGDSADKRMIQDKDLLLKNVREYNTSIYENGQTDFTDAWSASQAPLPLKGFQSKIFGYIRIPDMEVILPLYAGAGKEHMEKGAAILGSTSLPVGGKNTNSVIAAHRGYRGAPYFRDIEKLRTGDEILITNPWKTLLYRVESAKIIDPDDSDSVKIQKGRDMITLLTCHPYRSHGQYRYVVYCTRSDMRDSETGEQISPVISENGILYKSSQKDIRMEQIIRKWTGIVLMIMTAAVVLKKLLVRKKSNKL